MPTIKKEVIEKRKGKAIVNSAVKSHANDPFFVKKAEEAKDALSKMDISILKK